MEKKELKNKKQVIIGSVVILLVIVIAIVASLQNTNNSKTGISPELAKAMTYDVVKDGDEEVEGTNNCVQFDAFFLRDINGDGYTESIRGTSKEIGKEDTLYMELNVQTAGSLKNAKITVNGENFYLQTALPKDEQLKNNYIGNNIKTIEFNELANGTQKMLTGIVRSGDYSYSSRKADAIGDNINNYSKVNSVTLTGTYVAEDGTETPITKTVEFNIDWYGTTTASIYRENQEKDIDEAINEEEGTIDLDFTVYTQETDQELILSKNYVEGEIPELNGYAPISVEYTGNNAVFNYDAETKTFTITREATVSKAGTVTNSLSRGNSYGIRVTYPLEAYQTLGTDTVEVKIPVTGYYEGYNNPNEEFTNPYKSNIAKTTFIVTIKKPDGNVAKFEVYVGKHVFEPGNRYVISKEKPLKIYNGASEEEKDDTYQVSWYAYTGTAGESNGLVMKETKNEETQVTDQFIKTDGNQESMEDVTKNIGIGFSNVDNMLKEDGWIKIYDEDTGNLLVTFTKDDWNEYTSQNPYKYELPVKHIRIETSETNANASMYVYNLKELDDDYITTKYAKEQFDELQYIKSTLSGYIGGIYINTDTHQANYEAPISVANIEISNNVISTQTTEKNLEITIQTETNESYNEVEWKDGIFLVKLPEEIIDAEINNITVNKSNVKLENYELIEQDNSKFIKIVTKNDEPTTYKITIDMNLSPDPRVATSTKQVELYASNEKISDYYYDAKDIYDVNNNLNIDEVVNHTTTSISMIAPNSLLTNQIGTNFDDKGSMVISPQIADIKPKYAVVDQEEREEQLATIGVQIRNNYTNTTSEVQILGKIPFKGNTYVLSGEDLGSTFTTKMTSEGIEVPEELKQYTTVYYSENENPDKDLEKQENGWKTADQIENWDNVRTFLIDLGDYVMPTGKELVFNYTVKIPNGLEFNQVAFSHHGVYFCLDTEQGKYRTQTEPNKIGFRIAEKYNLELTKYQTGKDKLVAGATYSITEITKNEEGEERGEGKTEVTDVQGKLIVENLYVEREYEIREINSPDDYEINSNVIRFIGHVDEEGNLSIEKKEGTTRGDIEVEKEEGETYKIKVNVEDEAKATIKIIKKEQGTDTLIQGVRFKLTGYNLGEDGKSLTTNGNGEITFDSLSVNQEYTLSEVKAEGYYLASPIKFKIINQNGTYSLQITEGEIVSQTTIEVDSIPTINITIEDEKIPIYNLQLIKVNKTIETTLSEEEIADEETTTEQTDVEYLAGAKFKLYKRTKQIGGEYITDETGKVTIPGLYLYDSDKNIDQTYTLKEIAAPEGYTKVKDITFKAEVEDGALVLKEINEGEEVTSTKFTAEGDTIKLTIQDSPIFKLIKKDGETKSVIPNVKFAFYNLDAGVEMPATNSKGEIIGTKETINGIEYYTVTTNEKGEITVDLPEGLYKAVELMAPEQYDVENKIYYFGIGVSSEGGENFEATEVKSIKNSYSTSDSEIKATVTTFDEGYVEVGYFESNLKLGEKILYNKGSLDAMMIKHSAEGEIEWATSIGGRDDDEFNSIIQTKDGGFIVGGIFESKSIEVGTNMLNNNGATDGMVIKYNSLGEIEWAKSIGNSGNDEINSVSEIDGEGYVVGGFFDSSTIQLDGINLTNKGDIDGLLIKFDTKGEIVWAENIGNDGKDYIYSLDSTNNGGYIVGGAFESSEIQVGEYKLTNKKVLSMYPSDALVIKYSKEGQVEWADNFGDIGNETIKSVSVTNDGGIIAVGQFDTSIVWQDKAIFSKGGNDGIILKYDSKGEIEWINSVGGSGTDEINSVVATSDGGYLIGGSFNSIVLKAGNITLRNNLRDSSYSKKFDGMTFKFNSKGEATSGICIGGEDNDYIYTVAEMDNKKYIVGGGSFSNEIYVGDKTLKIYGTSDGIIIKLKNKDLINKSIVKKLKSVGGSENDYINNLAPTNDGGYIAAGYFSSDKIQVGDYELTNNGESDAIIIKYNLTGEVEWTKNIGGNNNDAINNIIATSDGGYIVAGYFSSDKVQVGDYELTNAGDTDGMIIKYGSNGEVEWARNIGGSAEDTFTGITSTSDGGYIVAGYFSSKEIQVGSHKLTSYGDTDGMLIKYNALGEPEWVESIGGSAEDNFTEITSTSDGGYIVAGYFSSDKVQVGDYELTNAGDTDGMIIKYSSSREVEWAKSINGNLGEYITSLSLTSDGGYLIGGYFTSYNVYIDDIVLSKGYDIFTGMIIKYDKSGKVEWAKTAAGEISAQSTNDGGFIISGPLTGIRIQIGDYILENNSDNTSDEDAYIAKYNAKGEVEWAKSIGNSEREYITDIIQTNDGRIIGSGRFNSNKLEVDGQSITNTSSNSGSDDSFIFEIANQIEASEVQELTIENSRKEFKITTEVKEIDGVKGGTISGEEQSPYETVKYGETSTQEIKMTPEENYEIIGITVNGKEWPFEELSDGTYTMPQFTNMTEDKHVEVTYALKDNKLTINKVDSETQKPLAGATFKLDQIEERTEPENVIGEIVSNGETFYATDTTNEITDEVVGELTNNGTYYFIKNEDGTLTPTNSKTYQLANGGTAGIGNTTANSYVEIDLSGVEGKYVVVVNANVSSQSSNDYGYAVINQSTNAPSYSTTTGRIFRISGTSTSSTTPTDYESEVLEGGQKYYLHLGYRKSSSTDTGDDQVVINNIKVYGTNISTYNFVENGEGGYESNNQGKDSTTANSYIPIDLTNNTGKYNLTINAQISSQSSDYGYATVTTSTDRVAYNINNSNAVRFVYISGEQDKEDYTTVLQGGQMYYLHLGYYKNASTSGGDDKFTVNSIEVTLNDSELYHTEVTTNSEGQGIVQIPFGKYQITETKAPEGYELNEEPIVIEFIADGDNHEITIENKESAKVIVHHYLKNNNGEYTTEKVAEDKLLEGKIGTNYTTTPYLDLEKYELEKDENGNYVIPEGASGIYESGTKEIIYYYEEKEIPLTVHHYIEGTTTPVPLKDGSEAEDVTDSGKEGTTYQTNEIEDSLLSDAYEISEIPENAKGTYSGEEVIVTYYYKQVKRPVTILKTGEDGEALKGVTFEIATKEDKDEVLGTYTTNEEGKITLTLPAGEYVATETEVPEDYQLPEQAETEFTVTKLEETITVNIENTKKKGEVITHHYIEGTEEKVPALEGGIVEDVTQTGNVGDRYATKQAENIANNYEYVSSTENTSGEIVEGTTEVIYYYKLKEPVITTPEITKESNVEKVTDVNQAIDYKVNYKTTIEKYIGKATVKIVDELPYEIDEQKSNIQGGTYNSEQKTITWTEEIGDIDTFVNGAKEISIEKEIRLVYKDIDVTKVNVTNKVTGTIKLETPEKEETVEGTKEIPTEYKINIPVEKVWDDNENEARKRPSAVEVVVKNGTQEVRRQELNDDNEWAYTFTGLPKYDGLGNEINYVISEEEKNIDDLKFYGEGVLTGSIEEGYTITNTFEVPDEKVSVKVTKKWVDTTEQQDKRPKGIEVVLRNGETEEERQELNATNNWEYTFTELAKYDSLGNEIEYTVDEVTTNKFYTNSGITGNMTEGYVITNTFVRPNETVDVPVTKIWEDNNDEAQKRPESITVKVTGNGQTYTQELNATNNAVSGNANNWTYTFTGLPKYDDNGNEIEYTIDEEDLNNEFYQKTNVDQSSKTITNTFQVPGENVTIKATKVWEDNNDEAKKRPENVTLQIKNGENVVASEVVNAEDNWTHEFSVPKYDSLGNEIQYTVDEADLGNKFYTKEGTTGNMTDGFTVTNKFEVPDEKIEIPVTKIWEDNNDEAQKRPESITVKVTGNGQTYTQELNATNNAVSGNANNWTYTFTGLPKYDDNGNEIEYTIDEEDLNNEFYQKTNVDQSSKTITNTFQVPGENVTIKATKVWEDNNNEAKKRPENVTLQVKDGDRLVQSGIVNEGNSWTYEFNVAKYDSLGKEIQYTVDEADLGNKFYTKVGTTGNMTDGFTVTNKFEVPDEKVEITVNKVWVDNTTQENRRPEVVTINVLGEEGKVAQSYDLKVKEGETSHTFTDLPKYNSLGNEIKYTVEEQEKIGGDLKFYTSNVSQVINVEGEDNKREATITNTFTVPEDQTNIIVNKIWKDNETQSNRRPESIVLVVKNGDQEVTTKEITKDDLVEGTTNQWSTTIERLQKYNENGEEIKYTVEEREKTEGDLKFYEAEETTVAVEDNQATIRNSFVKPDDTTSVTVNKIWNDDNDVNGRRPESIIVKVTGNGETKTQEINENNAGTNNNTWTYTFTDLLKYDDNGQEIVYTVEEQEKNAGDLKFYTNEGVTGDMTTGYTITNTFTVPDDRIELTVNKVWVDNPTQAQRRPGTVVINVKAENSEVYAQDEVIATYELNTAIETSHTFTDLPKYNGETGKEINYIVEEQEKNAGDLKFYTSSIGKVEIVNENSKQVTITNTFTKPEETTEVRVTKVWDDNGNDAQKRPASIKLQLKNRTETVKEQEVNESNAVSGNTNEWQYTFTGVEKYNDNGEEIIYTADETEVNSNDLQFYTKKVEGTTVTNTFTQSTDRVDIPVTKIWEDNETQRNRRPESVIIVLKRNGVEEQRYELSKETAETAEENKWTYTFKDLAKYDQNNNIIQYTVEEQEKNAGDLKFYTSKVDGTTITNTFTKPTETISIEVNKEWEDQENIYDKRPVSIRLEVKMAGEGTDEDGVDEVVVADKVVTKENNWSATFTNLPKYDDNGQEIEYKVDEKEVLPNDLFYYEKEVEDVTDKAGTTNEKEATITNTMTKIPGTVVVKYVDKNTGEEISDRRTKEGIIGDTFDVTEDKKDIEGYTLVEEPKDKTGTFTAEIQEKIYYYAKNTRVIVKYLEQDNTPEDIADNKVLAEEKTILGYEGESYSTMSENIDGYTLVDKTNNTSGTMQREEIVVIYYYAQNAKVTVKYLEKDDTPNDNSDNKVLVPEKTINGHVGQEYKTTEETIPGYTLVEKTTNTEGTMTKEPIEVIYYYAQNTKVVVKYLEKDTNIVLAQEETIDGYVGKDYETEQKDINNYTFVESTTNTKGTMTKDIIEVIYYYAQNTKAKVQHIDRETGEILKEETENGKVGDIFETHAEDFEGYILVESPEEPNIVMDKTGEQVVKYYYAHVSAGVIEKHIDEITGELLYSEEHEGNEGDYYNIPSKTFEGYDLVTEDEEGNSKLPTNAEGEMKRDEVIEVKYYYIKKAKVIVKYLEEDNTPEDTTDNKVLAEEEIIEGHENDSYETEGKEIKDYNLVEAPENSKGTMTITKNPDGTYDAEIEVIYYYKKQAGGVIENHIDITTNKKLATEEHEGSVGDSYDIPPREFEGYDLVTQDKEGNNRLPENAKGIMTEEEIEVNYYYIKQAKVRVEYIDKQTGEKLDEEEIGGHVGDEYTTEEKEFEGYDLVEKPSNSTGEMTEEEIVVKYYYERKAEVEVKYLEKGTEYEIAPSETLEGYVGDNYETEQKDIPYYKFVEKTENYKGKMEEEKITVIYYYEKEIFNLGIDKWVASVNIDGISQGAQNINSKDEIYKVDIHRKKTETANIKVTYKIRVTNKGEVEGTAGEIVEIIPEGYSYHEEDNSIHWEERNGILVTDELKEEMIQPGEYKEVEIVLRWDKGEENFGQKDNMVILSKIENPAGYEDIDKTDNNDTSSMIITVATGLDRNDRIIVIGIVQIVLAISIGLLLSYKKKEK